VIAKYFWANCFTKTKKSKLFFLGSSFCELKFDVWSNPKSEDTLSQLMYPGAKLISDGKVYTIKDKRKFVVGSSLKNWGTKFRFTADDYSASSKDTEASGVSG